MKKETRTVVYDDELRMEAYRFEGIVEPFPSHFHEHYVIGFVEEGERVLFCRDREYAIEEVTGKRELSGFSERGNPSVPADGMEIFYSIPNDIGNYINKLANQN